MKLLAIFLLFPVLLFAQKKGQPTNNGVLIKFTGGAAFPKNSDGVPYAMINVGPLVSNYLSMGFTVGYLKFKGSRTGVIPFGLEFNGSGFRSNKISPLGTFGVYFPIYNEQVKVIGSSVTQKGIFMGNMGIGVAFPASKYCRVAFAGHYMPLIIKTTARINTGGSWSNSGGNSTIDMFAATLNIIGLGKATKAKKK